MGGLPSYCYPSKYGLPKAFGGWYFGSIFLKIVQRVFIFIQEVFVLKKALATFLTLVLLISTVVCVPLLTSSASDEVPSFNFTDGSWGITKNAGGTATLNATDKTVSFTGAQYQSAYTKISNLTTGKMYDISIDVDTAINSQLWVLSGDEALSFNDTIPLNATCLTTINGTSFKVQLEAKATSYHLIFRNIAGTTSYKFSNLEISLSQNLTEAEIAGNAIADDEWKITPNAGGSVSNNKGSHTVSFTGTQSQTMYTKITGLTPNTAYKLSFEASPSINAQVWLLSGEANLSFTIDGTVPSGAKSIGAINGEKVEIEFTAEQTSHYIFFRNALTTSGTTSFTFSKFTFEKAVKEEVTPGDAIADGEWKITPNAGGTVSHNKNEHTVSFTGTQYQTMYTKITGLTANTMYKLTFEASPAMNAQVWMLSGNAAVSFTIDGTVPSGATSIVSVNGTAITVQFTAEEESHYLFFRNCLSTAATTAFTLSNFALNEKVAGDVVGDDVANGEWTLGEGGRSTTDLVSVSGWGKFVGANGTVTITDPNACRTTFTKVVGFVPGNTYELVFNASGIMGAKVVLDNGSAYIDGNYQSLITVEGKSENVVSATVEGSRYTVRFTAKNNFIYLTVKNNSGTVTLSDFIFNPVRISASTEWGGAVSISPSDVVAKNTEVTFTATPNPANFFVGWSNGEEIVSDQSVYTVKAESDISLIAIFDGKNKSSDDLFAQRGYDGTFEKGNVPGWYATHYNKADAEYVSFCNYTVSSLHAYQGEKSLRIQAYHRCSVLPITKLNKNTNYRLSFYLYYEDNGTVSVENNNFGHINASAVIDSQNIHISTAETVYAKIATTGIKPNSGWQRMDFYFNSGDAEAVNYMLYYGSDDYSTGCVYIDNLTLSEYSGNDTVFNADFSSTVDNGGINQPEGWITYSEAATEGQNGVLKLKNTENAYQILNTELDGLYTVSFKAKGKLRAAAVDIAKNNANILNLLSSASYVDTDSTGWKNYSFSFYSNNHKAIKLMFEGLADGAMVDDIKLTKAEMSSGGIVENIDFETERFALSDYTSDSFSIYTATSAKDGNVLSGKASLKFTPSGDDEKDRFIESYMSFQSVNGVSYTVTFNYKAENGGSLYLSPDMAERFCTDQPAYYSLDEKGWQKVQFSFTTLDTYTLKAILASVAESVKGTVYFDDISIKARFPLIQGYNLEKTYCDAFYNLIDYTSFENFKSSGSMGALPKGFSVIESEDAPSGTNIMTVKAGSKYIFAFKAQPSKIYQLGVTLKGDSKTKGSVSVAVDANGKYFYCDTTETPRSIISAPTNGDWVRDSFSFTTSTSGTVYVVIECTSGTMKVDDLMLFMDKYATSEDNNDYTVYEPYDYKNPPVKIQNGGINSDGTVWDGNADNWMASLGDFVNIELAIVLFVASAALVIVAVLIKKRKEEPHA